LAFQTEVAPPFDQHNTLEAIGFDRRDQKTPANLERQAEDTLALPLGFRREDPEDDDETLQTIFKVAVTHKVNKIENDDRTRFVHKIDDACQQECRQARIINVEKRGNVPGYGHGVPKQGKESYDIADAVTFGTRIGIV